MGTETIKQLVANRLVPYLYTVLDKALQYDTWMNWAPLWYIEFTRIPNQQN